jgi:predicted alpha/beta hydrolase
VIIAAAAAVKRSYYGEFAQFLADNGLTAVTFDYRGIGDSAVSPKAAKHIRMSDWGTLDLDAVIQWTVETYSLPVHFLGHSVGAQMLPLTPSNRHIRTAVLVGAASGGLRNVHPRTKRSAAVFAYVLGPLLSRLFDPFPAKRLGMGEDTPARAVRQLAAWTRSRDWLFGYLGKDLPDHRNSLAAHTVLLVFSDEDVVTVEGSRQFVQDARLRTFTIETVDVAPLGFAVGHLGMFKSRCRDAIWPGLLARFR